jgi:hypothetical protein
LPSGPFIVTAYSRSHTAIVSTTVFSANVGRLSRDTSMPIAPLTMAGFDERDVDQIAARDLRQSHHLGFGWPSRRNW